MQCNVGTIIFSYDMSFTFKFKPLYSASGACPMKTTLACSYRLHTMSATVCLSSVHEAGGFGEAASRKQVHMIKHRAREKHALAQQVEKHLLSFFGESQKFFDGNVIDGRAIHRKVDNIQGFAVATLCLRHVLVARTAKRTLNIQEVAPRVCSACNHLCGTTKYRLMGGARACVCCTCMRSICVNVCRTMQLCLYVCGTCHAYTSTALRYRLRRLHHHVCQSAPAPSIDDFPPTNHTHFFVTFHTRHNRNGHTRYMRQRRELQIYVHGRGSQKGDARRERAHVGERSHETFRWVGDPLVPVSV